MSSKKRVFKVHRTENRAFSLKDTRSLFIATIILLFTMTGCSSFERNTNQQAKDEWISLFNGKNLAIVDSSIEAHMLDLLIYRESAKVSPNEGPHDWMVCGKSCLAGDIFGEFRFAEPLQVGDRISIQDAAGYTMVKKNWFNGVKMPAIAVRELDGTVRLVRDFGYDDFAAALS